MSLEEHNALDQSAAHSEEELQFELSLPRSAPLPGDLCPQCGRGRLDYDGMLNLACAQCGYTLMGCFT